MVILLSTYTVPIICGIKNQGRVHEPRLLHLVYLSFAFFMPLLPYVPADSCTLQPPYAIPRAHLFRSISYWC